MSTKAIPRKTTAKTAAARVETQKTSVNEVAGRVRALWLGYLTLGTYLFIAVGSVTHHQLFLETPVRLPILNVDLPLIGFFAIAPLFFLVNHFYLLLTLLSLGRRIAEYNQALGKQNLALSVENEVRRKLDSFVIVLALAGTPEERSGRTSTMLRTIVWLTVVGTPVILLLFMQLTFLPYHHAGVTWLHRGVLIVDLALLWVFWPAIQEGAEGLPVPRPKQKPVAALWLALLAIFSILVATFPGEILDQNKFSGGKWFPVFKETENAKKGKPKRLPVAVSFYQLLFLGDVDRVTGKRKSLSSNTLVLPDQDFVDDEKLGKIIARTKDDNKKPWEGERTRTFRGHDLRGAVLSRADLRNVDFTGAKLQGANLTAARMQGAEFGGARMQGVNLTWAQMQGADLTAARMQGTNLFRAEMQGANLGGAWMQGANLGGAQMQGANLGFARMQGANLGFAQMQGADLGWAQMQGANLGFARMQGADLRGARMQGADLRRARMQGADLRRVQMQGADLFRARIWQVTPVESDQIKDADLRELSLASFYPDAALAVLAGLKQEPVRKRVEKRFARLLDLDKVAAWAGSDEWKTWRHLKRASRSAPAVVAKILTDLACEDDTGGYIIKSIARRVSDIFESEQDYAKRTSEKLIDPKTCPAAKHLSEKTLARLRKITERGTKKPPPLPSPEK